ncbi:MAG: class I mannose-6-phosphate isomerase, partial [Acidobacteriota bacterium]|nr:class I mannose-6-phosphate isomerase [Acidobacteriota bacterium]
MTSPVRLPWQALEKVWGSKSTEPWLRNPEGRLIGEVWFTASDAVPILVKLLFTSDKLSIQVHPGDEYAGLHESSPGKTEMWHVLRAEPDAQVGIGLREPIERERLREAIVDGSIEDLLRWVPAAVGDTFFIPAGTIHAIGGGLVLCEVQQVSDVTYRLHDYGRGRDLHVQKAMDVSDLTPHDGRALPLELGEGRTLLKSCEYFRTERLVVRGRAVCPAPAENTLYVAIGGEGMISGAPFVPGEAWEVMAGADPVE